MRIQNLKHYQFLSGTPRSANFHVKVHVTFSIHHSPPPLTLISFSNHKIISQVRDLRFIGDKNSYQISCESPSQQQYFIVS